jgi:hypothetical protein
MTWYHVAEPNSYLVVTGVGIEKVKIQKKVSQRPFISRKILERGERSAEEQEAVSAYASRWALCRLH